MFGLSIRMIIGLFISLLINALIVGLSSIGLLPESVLPIFAARWSSAYLVLTFLRTIPVALVSGVLVSWSILIDKNVLKKIGNKSSFARMLEPTIVLALITFAVYILGLALIEGPSLRQMKQAVSDSHLARYYLNRANSALADSDVYRAHFDCRQAIAVAPAWQEARLLESQIVEKKAGLFIAPAQKTVSDSSIPDYVSWDVLFDKVKTFANKNDLFTALYWAELAQLAGTPGQKQETLRFVQEINQRLGYIEPESSGVQKLGSYELKQLALAGAYRQGRYIDAYFGLRALEEIDSKDSELLLWMPRVLDKLSTVSFFIDEYEEALGHASSGSVLIRLNSPNDNVKYLFARRVLSGRHTFFFSDLDLIELSPDGTVLVHVFAELAKVLPDNENKAGVVLLLQGIDRKNPEIGTTPIIKTGQPMGAADAIYKVQINMNDVWMLSNVGRYSQDQALFDLIPLQSAMIRAGWDTKAIEVEILNRFSANAMLIVFWFAAVALAWSNRSRYAVVPIFLLVPVLLAIPVLVYAMFSIFDWISGMVLAWVRELTGFWTAGLVSLIIISLGLIFSLFSAAIQKLDD